jgi:hypothetical protein
LRNAEGIVKTPLLPILPVSLYCPMRDFHDV